MSEFNPYAPPKAPISPEGQHLNEQGGLWRDGPLLVIRKGTPLPDHCLKCNAPADGYRLKRTLSWHHPALFILAISPIIYIIVALIVRHTAKVSAGLCPLHRSTRRRAIAVGWLGSLVGIGVIIFGGYHLGSPGFLVGGLLLLGFMIYGVVGSQVMTPQRINKHYVWLRKVSPEYLLAQPDWK